MRLIFVVTIIITKYPRLVNYRVYTLYSPLTVATNSVTILL
jgi:hypothetical protein